MTLQFPIQNDFNYPATVTFTPVALESYDVTSVFTEAQRGSLNNNATVTEASGEAGGAPVGSSIGTVANFFSRRAFYGGSGIGTRIEGTGQKVKQVFLDKQVQMFLPQAVQITDAASYNNNMNLGILGAGTEAGLAAGVALDNQLGKETANTISSYIDAFRGEGMGTPVGRLAQVRAAQAFLPNDGAVMGAVRSGTRVTINPNTRALFQSVPLRDFTFTFKMIPSSKLESATIKSIIKIFREELYPDTIKIGGTNGITAGYELPNVFEIFFSYNGVKDALATKLLPSYLRNFSVTYNSSGMGFYEGGDFSEVDISMSFTESSALNKKLVQKGY